MRTSPAVCLALGFALGLATPLGADGPPGIETVDRTIYEATGAIAPRHPVTGKRVFNVVPEALEVKLAREFFRDYTEEAHARGIAIDPPGERLARLRRTFDRLVAVAHRRNLPWEVHLVDDATENAFTPGGGLVVVLAGLWNGMLDVPPGSEGQDPDEALAAVLAHEIAHVTLLHPPQRVSWLRVGGAISKDPDDPYYRAAYTLEQEAEADRLSTLYLALAGFDPLAAARLWRRVSARGPDSAAASRFLHDHPVHRERIEITEEAGRQVAQYWRPGRRHPRSAAILADNVLYPRVADDGYRRGDGFGNAARTVLDVFRVHKRASEGRDERRASVDDHSRIRIVGTWPEGGEALAVDVWNGGRRTVRGLRFAVAYWNRGHMVLVDECEQAVPIEPGTARAVSCLRQGVESDRIEPRITDVRW